jgi:hypothetical protein
LAKSGVPSLPARSIATARLTSALTRRARARLVMDAINMISTWCQPGAMQDSAARL